MGQNEGRCTVRLESKDGRECGLLVNVATGMCARGHRVDEPKYHTFELDDVLPADRVPLFEALAKLVAGLLPQMNAGDIPVLVLTITAPPSAPDGDTRLTVLHYVARDFCNPADLVSLAQVLPAALLATFVDGDPSITIDTSAARNAARRRNDLN